MAYTGALTLTLVMVFATATVADRFERAPKGTPRGDRGSDLPLSLVDYRFCTLTATYHTSTATERAMG